MFKFSVKSSSDKDLGVDKVQRRILQPALRSGASADPTRLQARHLGVREQEKEGMLDRLWARAQRSQNGLQSTSLGSTTSSGTKD